MGKNKGRTKNERNITTMVLASLAIFIYMLLIGTFMPFTSKSGVLPVAMGATVGFVIFQFAFGTRFERLLNKIVSIGFGFAFAGLYICIAQHLKIAVKLPILVIFLIIGVCISVAAFRLLEKKAERKRVEMTYKTDERGAILNDKSATVGFIALSLFLLAYLIKDYFEAGIFDKILILTLSGCWVVFVLTRLYYEWRM